MHELKANLDLKQNLNIYATCKQLDNLNLILSIYDNSVQVNLSNYTVRLRAMKADKVPLIQEGTGISTSSNVVTIECDEQLTTTSGKTLIELQFIDKVTSKKKATFNLVLIVVSSTLEVDRSISKATYTLLEELENKLDQASDFFENIDEAITANNNLIKSITTGTELNNNLNSHISTGTTLNTELEINIPLATNINEDLETTIPIGQTLLDSLEDFENQHADVADISNQLANINASLNETTQEIYNDLNSAKEALNIKDSELQQEIATERARIDSFTTLAEGSTTGDAELIDARIGVDGTTYANVGDAIRTQIKDNITEYVALPFTLTAGFYIHYLTGNIIEYDSEKLYASDFVELVNSDLINIKNLNHPSNDLSGLAFYNENKKFISGYQYNKDSNLYLKVPTGAKYIRFSVYETSIYSIKVYQSTYTTFIKNKEILEEKIAYKVDNTILDMKENAIEVINDCYISYSGAKVKDSNSYHVMSDEISLSKGDVICVKCQANKDVVSIISKVYNNVYTPLVISIEGQQTYRYEALDDIDVVISARHDWDTKYTWYNKFNPKLIENIDIKPSFSLFEKFAVIGDSYASGEVYIDAYTDYYNISWGQILARMSGNKCLNLSAGGLSTRSWLTSEKGLNLLNSSEVQQLYICALGINDYYHLGESYLGTVDDISTQSDSFFGNYAKIINSIKTKAPNAKILMMTTANRSEVATKFNDAIMTMANHYNIPCIKQHEDAFFNSSFYTKNMIQGHPIGIVYSAMAKNFRRLIEKSMFDNIEYFKYYIG